MLLSDLISYLNRATSKNIYEVLQDINSVFTATAGDKFQPWLLFITGIAVALVIGFFGYKLIKLTMALVAGYAGYFIGAALFTTVLKEAVPSMPSWFAYVCAIVIGVLFFALGFIKFSYVLFSVASIAGYCLTAFYTDSQIVAIGGAFVLAVLSVLFIRTFYIIATSAGCGVLIVSFLHALLPKVTWLNPMKNDWRMLLITGLLVLTFGLVQLFSNLRRSQA